MGSRKENLRVQAIETYKEQERAREREGSRLPPQVETEGGVSPWWLWAGGWRQGPGRGRGRGGGSGRQGGRGHTEAAATEEGAVPGARRRLAAWSWAADSCCCPQPLTSLGPQRLRLIVCSLSSVSLRASSVSGRPGSLGPWDPAFRFLSHGAVQPLPSPSPPPTSGAGAERGPRLGR